MSYASILVQTSNRVTTVTLNRPEKRNALNPQLISELQSAFDNIAEDTDTKVVHLRANGPAFSAGADLEYLKSLQANSYEDNLADSRQLMRLLHGMYSCPKPLIAIVNGPAIAGGCGLVTVCDFALASHEAEFGYSEVKIGFVPALVMIFLVKRVGESTARRLLLTGDLISANEAQQVGLITKSASTGDLEQEVSTLTEQLLTQTSGQSVRRIKKMFDNLTGLSLGDALNYAAIQNAETRSTVDCKKGIDSFLSKVKPSW